MKIGWNVLNCGLGNNGGSRTIILCNNTLNKMGHQSTLLSNRNLFTWFKLPKTIDEIPSGLDALISVQGANVPSTLKSDAKIKAWYIRSFLPEIDHNIKNITKITNSENLKRNIVKLGVDEKEIHVIRHGIEFDWWRNLNLRDKNKIRIGCLYNTQPKKRWDIFKELSQKLDTNKFEFVSFGSPNKCEDSFLTKYLPNPSVDELVKLYSSCHIWFAPTESEGLHNVPMEANLCGCLVICGNNPANGMLYDYAFPDKTSMVYNNIEEAIGMINNPNFSLIKPMQECIHENIGTRENAMKKLVEILSQ